jgi:hypothetical protein
MKLRFGLIFLGLLVGLSACAPMTLVRADVASEFTRDRVSKEGIALSEFQMMQPFELITQSKRNQIDGRIQSSLTALFGEKTLSITTTLNNLKPTSQDGELLAALNEYKLYGRLRPDSLDRALESLNCRYLVMSRFQSGDAGRIGREWLIFPTIETYATISLAVYDRQSRRLVTEIITNGFAKKGVFGGGLIDWALDQAVDTALGVLKSRVPKI